MSLIVFSTMLSSYFASITEHSFLCICKVFISKEFVRFSYGLGRFYASKRIIQSKDFDASVHAHSVSSAVQRVPFGRRWIMSESCATLIPFGERIISFGRAKAPFGEKFIITL